MALVLVSDRPRRFNVVPDGSGQGLIDHTTPATTPDPHAMYATDADLAAHASATDPHSQYATDADMAAHVAAGNNPHTGQSLVAGSTAFGQVEDIARFHIANHAGLADPHPVYATDTDVADKAPLLHAGRHSPGNADDISGVYVARSTVGQSGGPASFGHSHPRVLGPYRATNGVALASGSAGRTAASVVVPDPGFDWYAQAFGLIEVRVGATGTRAAAGIFRTDTTFSNAISWGSGLDPVNQGSGGNGYWLIPVIPFGANDQMANHKIAAGAAASARTFILSPCQDYGSANLDSTAFRISLIVWVNPA